MGRYGYSYLNESRLKTIKAGDNQKHPDWNKAVKEMGEWLTSLRYKKKTDRVSLILNTWMSNEELYLVKKIFKDALEINRFYFVDIPDDKGDELLLTAERTPNKRGAKELGFDLIPLDPDEFANKTEIVLVFGSFLTQQYSSSDLQAMLEPVKHKILFASHDGEWTDQFDLVLPVSLIPEKGGSLTNVDGFVQEFAPVLEAVGDSRAEWDILIEMAKAMDLDFKYYKQFSSPEKIRSEMGKEIPFFGK